MKTPYPGLDYSGPGSMTNRDQNRPELHYGVISCNSLMPEAIYEAQEFEYPPPNDIECPECGAMVKAKDWGETVECPNEDCEYHQEGFEVEMPDMMEPCGWSIDDGEYKIIDCLDNDAMVVKSPYYTYAQFCSPCVPGAGNLDNPYLPEMDGLKAKVLPETFRKLAESAGFPKTYCLGYDWFDEYNPCPYPVMFRVDDDTPVLPTKPNEP